MPLARITVVNHTGADLVPYLAGGVGRLPTAHPELTIPDHGSGSLAAGDGTAVLYTAGRLRVGLSVELPDDDGPRRLVSVVHEYRAPPDHAGYGDPHERGRYRLLLDADTTEVAIDLSRDFTVRYGQRSDERVAGA